MNYADSFRKAQANYDAMEPPSDPPWLEAAIEEAEEAISFSSDDLLQAMNNPYDASLCVEVSELVSYVVRNNRLPSLRNLLDAIHEAAVSKAILEGPPRAA